MVLKLSLSFILLFVIGLTDSRSQEIQSDFKGTIGFVELIGHNLTYSLNLESHLKEINNINLGVRFGLGGIPNEYGAALGLTGFTGEKKGHFDFGIALSYVYGAQSYQDSGSEKVMSSTIFIVPTIGYRYQRPTGGFFFKAGITPLFKLKELKEEFASDSYWKVLPSIGICVGHYFKKT